MPTETNKHVRYNFIVNMLDGGFFGSALGLASFVTVLPLFVSTLTDSAILIGLVSAIHSVGWQLPQLLTVDWVARLGRYKPMVVLMTLHERLPFFGLAVVAWFLPILGPKWVLPLTFGLLIWQGLGGGFTATAWQSMIGKIIPVERRGIFFGAQSAAANLGGSMGAIGAGFLLERFDSSASFTFCFLLAGLSMMISWAFLAQVHEPGRSPTAPATNRPAFQTRLSAILRRDANFRWFLVARTLLQLATMAFGFYAVYAVRYYGMAEGVAGLMTSIFMAVQIAANPLMGWMGDRWGHRTVMGVGAYAAATSALLAWLAPGANWFYLVFALAGIANVASWTIGLAMTLEFGGEAERPAYIGLANTLVAPSTILAPLMGGWLADTAGYPATFLVSVVGGLATALVLQILVRDPHRELCYETTPICYD